MLWDHKQCVAIGDAVSGFHTLDCDVPQGSVFGSLEFTLYTAPVEDIIAIARCSKYDLRR